MLDLVIPDTGPLITLGLIGRFDLLERFRCPILVTDMIARDLYDRHAVAAGEDVDWQEDYDRTMPVRDGTPNAPTITADR